MTHRIGSVPFSLEKMTKRLLDSDISIAVGVALVQLGRYMSRAETPFLSRLVVDATEAKSKKAAPRQQ